MGLQGPNANEAMQTASRSGRISPVLGICARCIPCGVDARTEHAGQIVNV